MSKLRVLVAIDHDGMRSTIIELLRREFDVVSAVSDGRRLVEIAIELRPDVIVSDVWMPVLGGLEAMRKLRDAERSIPFVLISEDASEIAALMWQGAVGFVDEFDIGCELAAAVRAVTRGEAYVSHRARL